MLIEVIISLKASYRIINVNDMLLTFLAQNNKSGI